MFRIAGEFEHLQIIQELLLKNIQSCKVSNVLVGEMQVFDVFDHLLQSRTDRIAAVLRVGPVKHVENDGLVHARILKVSLHHCQFVQICQKREVSHNSVLFRKHTAWVDMYLIYYIINQFE